MNPVTLFRGNDPDTAVAVADGVIVAIGRDALDMKSAETVELGRGWLVPAFRDGHIHPVWGGQSLLGAQVTGSTSVAEVVDRIATYAAAHPGGGWIVGAGYDPSLLPGGFGRADLLDVVVTDRPVLLWASDHHSAWVNSPALAAAGITASTPDPARGRIVRDGDGRPTGALLEDAAQAVAALIPTASQDDKVGALKLSTAQLVRNGIVWVQDASLVPEDIGVYTALADAGELPCRVNVALKADPRRWREQVAEFVEARQTLGDRKDVTARTVKFFADGIIEAGTAALLEPYADDHASCGIANWPADELAQAVVAFDAAGFQAHIHAIGDAAVRAALDAVDAATGANGRRDRRSVIAHTQLVHPDDLGRFAALGVVANFEPLWAQPDPLMTELTEPRLGQQRSTWQYPMAAIAATGAALSFGSDWPVSSMAPLEGIAIAVTRQTRDGVPPGGWLPAQRLDLDAALGAYTHGVAYQCFEENVTGRIAVGQRADLCLLEAAPGAVGTRDLGDVQVLATWSGGREVFRA